MATQKQILTQIRDEIIDTQVLDHQFHDDLISIIFVFGLIFSYFLGWIAGDR